MEGERAEAVCPSCGGAGGGPLGRAGRGWDTESYVCPRCEGLGVILVRDVDDIPLSGPGIVKVAPSAPPPVAIPPVPMPFEKRIVGKA
jgi:hypothetical protein